MIGDKVHSIFKCFWEHHLFTCCDGNGELTEERHYTVSRPSNFIHFAHILFVIFDFDSETPSRRKSDEDRKNNAEI